MSTRAPFAAEEFRITQHQFTDQGMRVEFPASINHYYRLLRGEQIQQISQPVALQLGSDRDPASGAAIIEDSNPSGDMAFYRLEELPLGNARDSDGDGLSDVFELRLPGVLNPLSRDSNGNGIPDGAEDFDGDGLPNAAEAASGTHPLRADSDFNGVKDPDEDPDSDSVSNQEETRAGTDPLRPDSDGDGWNDEEGRLGGDPLDPRVIPYGIVAATPAVDLVFPSMALTPEGEAHEIIAAAPWIELVSTSASPDSDGLAGEIVSGSPSVDVVSAAAGTDGDGLAVEVTAGLPNVVVGPSGEGVDLAVRGTVSPTWVREGDPVTLTARVENHGRTQATGVQLRFPLPPGATVRGLTSSTGVCQTQDGAVVCTVDVLPPGGLTIEATFGTDGILANDGDGFWWWDFDWVAASNEPDINPSDNHAPGLFAVVAELDYGDAPEPLYPTLWSSNGARHRRTLAGPRFASPKALPFVPANPDLEWDGAPTDHADGDDSDGIDDEGGVVFLTPLEPGKTAQVEIHFENGLLRKLDAWIDFDRHGWTTVGEKILNGTRIMGPSPLLVEFTVPTWAVPGQTAARFRISSAGTPNPTGYAADGEVEDYWVEIEGCNCPKTGLRIGSDPLLDSWYTVHSGELARIREEHGATPVTEWSNRVDGVDGAYADIQKIASYGGYVYVQTFGLASHIMGPWYFDAADSELFPNKPDDRNLVYRIPQSPAPDPAVHSNTPMGIIGLWVNGTAIYNTTDGFSWSGSLSNSVAHVIGMDDTAKGSNFWHRSAWFAESVTFDYTLFHSPSNGEHHSHVHPAALRLQLNDNVFPSINIASGETVKINESILPPHHSPILGWAADGFPIYGPYGFSDPYDTSSGVRRMVSGYVLRDGGAGTVDLRVTGRTSLPAWAYRWNPKAPASLTNNLWGPETTRPGDEDPSVRDRLPFKLGRYLEDYEYLGDLPTGLGKPKWDLDQFNGRCCVTPEFPNGTYAYFVTIDENGVPAFPYVLGPQYCGEVKGGVVGAIPANPGVEVHFEHIEEP